MGPFDGQLTRLIRSIPSGHVVTYGELGRMLDGRLSLDEVAVLTQGVCHETVMARLADPAPNSSVLPCWRVISDAPANQWNLSEAASSGPDDPMYRLVILPLVEEGLALHPPHYRIPAEAVFHWTTADESSLGVGSVDEATRQAREVFFAERAEAESKQTLAERCQRLSNETPSLGDSDAPIGYIFSAEPTDDAIMFDLSCETLWGEDVRTVCWPRFKGSAEELRRAVINLEDSLVGGQWQQWTLRSDGRWQVPLP